MEQYLQQAVTLLSLAGMLFAIYKDWQRDKRDSKQQNRAELQSDYDRVKKERDELLERYNKCLMEKDGLKQDMLEKDILIAKLVAKGK